MPRESKPSTTVWVAGLLIAIALVAAGVAAYLYSHMAK